jgi:DNA helicase-2/ATP-dependent DNA helicase PcrA
MMQGDADLAAFVQNWQARRPPAGMNRWPRDWPLLELIFTLASWFPFLQEDPEGQVYLEAVARTIAEVGQMETFRAQILQGTAWDDNSVRQAIRSVFVSIADESVDVDEEVMPRVPRNYFPIMTVHQAKGLEFPLVIADVGSDYRKNHPAQRPFRYPNRGDSVHAVEDDTANYSPIGPVRMQRTAVDRAWDDIRRLYFVAYSRPHDVLLLVGLTSQLAQPRHVPGIATGDLFSGPRAVTFAHASAWDPNMPNADSTVALI